MAANVVTVNNAPGEARNKAAAAIIKEVTSSYFIT
jgi:hypothetical protein